MALRDILVGLDRSTAGEGHLKLALNLAHVHRAHLTACYIMRGEHGGSAGMPVNLGPGIIVAPEVLAPAGELLPATIPGISREAERAENVEQLFWSELRLHGIDGEWHLLSPGETATLIDLSKSFDLIILGQLSPDACADGLPVSYTHLTLPTTPYV